GQRRWKRGVALGDVSRCARGLWRRGRRTRVGPGGAGVVLNREWWLVNRDGSRREVRGSRIHDLRRDSRFVKWPFALENCFSKRSAFHRASFRRRSITSARMGENSV